MIDPNEINTIANKLDNAPSTGLQKMFADNTASESDLLTDFTKEVESPFLEGNRRKPTDLKKDKEETNWWGGKKEVKTEQSKPNTEKEKAKTETTETNTDDDEKETYSFADLDDSEDKNDDTDAEDKSKFNRDLIEFVLSGIDYAATKGGEMAGYQKKKGSSELKAQKNMVIKYGVEVLNKYDFQLQPEHMLLLAMLFYIKASYNQFEKVKEDEGLTDIKNSHLKVVKSSKPTPRNKENETEKPKKEVIIKQSIL